MRERYGPNAGETLARIDRLVYQAPEVRIYAVEGVPADAAVNRR